MSKRTPHPTDKHVGSRMRMRRIMLGMSQTTLADVLGLTFQQVQKYEKGSNRMAASRLQHIAQVLQVPHALLLRRYAALDGAARRRCSVANLCIRLPRHVGRACAHQGLHALKDAKLRRCIVELVKQIAGDDER